MMNEKFKNGGWKTVSVILGFMLQFGAIIWWVSSMNSKIDVNAATLSEMKPVVESVNIRMIRVEAQIATINRDLEDCREHIAQEGRGGG